MRYFENNTAHARPPEFQPRRWVPSIVQLILVVGLSFITLMCAYLWAGSALVFAAVVIVLLAFVNGMMIWESQRARDQVLSSEFQNALFSSAIRLNTLFCLILHRDGTVAYCNEGFTKLFPRFNKGGTRHVDLFFEQAGLLPQQIDQLYSALAHDEPVQLVADLRDGDGLRHRVMVSMDPLRRPHEFAILRARSYVEDRRDA